jgi:hypothetical protein
VAYRWQGLLAGVHATVQFKRAPGKQSLVDFCRPRRFLHLELSNASNVANELLFQGLRQQLG